MERTGKEWLQTTPGEDLEIWFKVADMALATVMFLLASGAFYRLHSMEAHVARCEISKWCAHCLLALHGGGHM